MSKQQANTFSNAKILDKFLSRQGQQLCSALEISVPIADKGQARDILYFALMTQKVVLDSNIEN